MLRKLKLLLLGLIICFSFLIASCGGGGGEGPVTPVACTYTYSEWGACQSDNTQTRTVISALPDGCVGSPITSQTCAETRGTFVASGGNGIMLTSPDGINWDVKPSEVVGEFSKVVQGNNTFVIWQNERTFTATIFSSADLMNWTVRSSNTFPAIDSMIYANNLFVAVSSFGFILTSPDGVNWTHSATVIRSDGGIADLQSIAYGNGTFVTVSAFGGIYHSQDCVNWTRAASNNSALYAVAYGNGIFVAAGGNEIFTSSDGANWTAKTLGPYSYFDIFSLATGNNMFVALGWKIADPLAILMIFNSPDGVNWTGGPSTINTSPANISFEHGLFFLTGNDGTILTSPDGINWTARTSGTTGQIGLVTFVNILL